MTTSNRPIVRIHNVETNEIVDREMNDAEFLQIQAEAESKAAAQAEAESKATARAAILNRLGLTAEEAELLLS
jgi:hypothetical protein